jgi:hypothetical protein
VFDNVFIKIGPVKSGWSGLHIVQQAIIDPAQNGKEVEGCH